MIDVQHLVKKYGKKESTFTALDDVSFEIENGTTVAIIGKSGSGKSTLMHIMSGLDKPTSGTISINGDDIFLKSQKKMDAFRANEMSFIFQSFFVEANQTCLQNVMLPLEIARIPLGKRTKMVMDALKSVELEDKATNLAANLSGGQRQRLAIARAIVNKPSILFADEPTGNLDSVTGEKIMQLLLDLNKELKCTIVLVTHDQELAERCSMQVSMKDGTVQSILGDKKRGTR